MKPYELQLDVRWMAIQLLASFGFRQRRRQVILMGHLQLKTVDQWPAASCHRGSHNRLVSIVFSCIAKFLIWVFWKLYYLVWRDKHNDLDQLLIRLQREQWPWWKFRPFLMHNDDGGYWEIYFKNDQTYTTYLTIHVAAHISNETGQIVGFDVGDRALIGFESRK